MSKWNDKRKDEPKKKDAPKFCVNCANHTALVDNHKCTRLTKERRIDLVTGEFVPTGAYLDCETERLGACGEAALFFKPKG